MKKLLLVFPLVFFILFSTSVFAYLPIEYQTQKTLVTTMRDIDCINETSDNKIYCAGTFQQVGSARIYLFNETFNTMISCNVNTFLPNVAGICLMNKSFAWATDSNSRYQFLVNLTSGNCSLVKSHNAGLEYNTNGCSRLLIFGVLNGLTWSKMKMTNENGGLIQTTNYNYDDISFVNNSNIQTYWSRKKEISPYDYRIKKYVNETNTISLNLSNTYGVSSTNDIMPISTIRVNSSTTWLYFALQSNISSSAWNFYKTNLTYAENNLGSTLANTVSNNTKFENEDCFRILLTTNYNGTLKWFLNGTSVYNESISIAPISNREYKYCFDLETGSYNVYAIFVDTNANSWYSSLITFSVRGTGIINIIIDGIKGLFNFETSESASNILGLILSILIAVGVAVRIQDNAGVIFIGLFVGCMVVFWVAGLVSFEAILPILIGIGLLFAYTMGKVFTGD